MGKGRERMCAAFIGLETPRLRLRSFQDADLPTFLAYRNDPEVARYQSWDTTSESDARTLIREFGRTAPGTPGEGVQIAIALKSSGELIGDIFFLTWATDPRQGEIGYTLAQAFHHQGYATEAVGAFLDYAFRTFDLHRITAVIDVANGPSIRLVERLGMRREGHFRENVWFKGRWADEYLYAILRPEWDHSYRPPGA